MSTSMPASRRQMRRFAVVTVVGTTVLLLVLAEGVLRLLGQPVLQTDPVNIVVEPGQRLFRTDDRLGYAHLPGRFRVTVRDALTFTVTHDAQGRRRTSPQPDSAAAAAPPDRPEVWLLGGSYTHGWTVNDEETFAWQLQRRMPPAEVVNYGVSGYGTIHALVQVEEALAAGARPALVVLHYAGFHDERNTFLRSRRKAVALWSSLGEQRQPYARLDADGQLVRHRADALYSPFPLARHSAFMHTLERAYNRLEHVFHDSHAVSEALVLALAAQCDAAGIQFVVAGISDEPTTQAMLTFARQHGIKALDIAEDLTQPGATNRPYDGHPSARTHARYAERLHAFLQPLLPPASNP